MKEMPPLTLTDDELQNFKNALSFSAFGMTTSEAKLQRICVRCRKPHVPTTKEGSREYERSALCSSCFDAILEATSE